jgi:uncharacterized membrane protein (UPF0182 family)
MALLIVLGLVSDFMVDWLWFSSIGYFGVFLVMFRAKAPLFLAVFVASALALWVNAAIASHFAGPGRPWPPVPAIGGAGGPGIPEALLALVGPIPRRRRQHLAIAGAAILLGILIAWADTSDWNLALRFLHQSPYGLLARLSFTAR